VSLHRTRTGGHGWQQMWRCLNGRRPTPLPASGIRRGRPSGLALQLLGTSDVGVSGIQGEWLRFPAPARAGRLALLGDPYLCHPLLLLRSRRSRSLPSSVAGKWPGVAMASTRMSTRRAVIQGYRLAGTHSFWGFGATATRIGSIADRLTRAPTKAGTERPAGQRSPLRLLNNQPASQASAAPPGRTPDGGECCPRRGLRKPRDGSGLCGDAPYPKHDGGRWRAPAWPCGSRPSSPTIGCHASEPDEPRRVLRRDSTA
jgi:hypothetical protein